MSAARERRFTNGKTFSFFWWLLWSGGFALAYAQSPLFTSNQNQYFLHGLARAGFGYLSQDWAANTTEPTPLFTWLVEIVYRGTHQLWIFYLIYALLMGIYVYSLHEITDTVYPLRQAPLKRALFLGMILVFHSAGWREALSRSLGENWAYLVEDGVADQRLLGAVFQPSTFGVLLLLAIALFLKKRTSLSVLCLVLATSFHPTYLFSAACLTAAFMLENYRQQRKVLASLGIGGGALVGVLPILSYVYMNFAGTSSKIAAKAQHIMVWFRLPHHALPLRWLDITVIMKLGLIFLAVYLVRRQRLFWIISLPLSLGILGTLVQMISGSEALALLFPWRVSTWLMPMSLALVVGWGLDRFFSKYAVFVHTHQRFIFILIIVAVIIAVTLGMVRFKIEMAQKEASPEQGLFSFVRASLQAGQTYLIPVKMLDFRLETGAPAFIDFKTPPYKATEVLEWYRRIQLAQRFYRSPSCDLLLRFVKREGVTHVILPAKSNLSCSFSEAIYTDAHYQALVLR